MMGRAGVERVRNPKRGQDPPEMSRRKRRSPGSITDQKSDTHNNEDKQTIYVCSLYWAGDQDELPPELTQVIAKAKGDNVPIIVCGDFNAHSTLWGGNSNDRRGDLIECLLADSYLQLLNTGNTPTFRREGAQSIIDLSLTSANILERVKDWQASPTHMGSDHSRIDFKLAIGSTNLLKAAVKKRTRRSFITLMNPSRITFRTKEWGLDTRNETMNKINVLLNVSTGHGGWSTEADSTPQTRKF